MHSTFGTHTMRTLQDIKTLLSLIGTYHKHYKFFSIAQISFFRYTKEMYYTNHTKKEIIYEKTT